MANSTDILNRLRAYEVPPPPAAFGQLMARLQQEAAVQEDQWAGAWQGLQQLDIAPPPHLTALIEKAVAAKPVLAGLQEHAVEPPPAMYRQVLKHTAGNSSRAVAGTVSAIRSFFHRFRAVAAVLLLMIAGYTWYQIATYRATPAAPVAFNHAQAARPQPAKPATARKPAAGNAMARYNVYDNPRTENYFERDVFVADGSGLPLIDNDFLVTFASYDWDDLPAFLYEEEESELLVRLDQYSYFTISENMMNNLRKMYQRRAKGTPTRKARREMIRLEKWKQADEKQFDKQHSRNPLDPIDLAEFVFDY